MRIIKNIIFVLLIISLLGFMALTLKYVGDTVQIHKTITLKSSYNTKAVVDNNAEKEMVVESNTDKDKLFNLPSSCYLMITGESLLLSIVIVCFILSFNNNIKESFLRNKKKYIILEIILFLILIVTCIIITKTIFKPGIASEGKPQVYINGAKEIIGKKTKMTGTIDTNEIDKSCVIVKDNGQLFLNSAYINKINGKSSNISNSKENGVNSSLAVVDNSTTSISGSNIKSNAYGSSGLYVRGNKSNVYTNKLNIETTKEYSPSIEIAYLGNVKAAKSNFKTMGKFSPSINIEKENGTISLDECNLQTVESEIINSMGSINIINSKLKTNNTRSINLHGNAMLNIQNSKLSSFPINKKKNNNIIDYSFLIDKGVKNNGANILISNSIINISKQYSGISLFKIDSNNATINISNTNVNYGNNKLLDVFNNSNAYLLLDNENINGDISVDNTSKLLISISSNTAFSGSINSSNINDNISLIIDKTSTIVLNKDTYVKSLEDNDKTYNNINLNGHKLFVNNKELGK